jgi:hypothetical protein
MNRITQVVMSRLCSLVHSQLCRYFFCLAEVGITFKAWLVFVSPIILVRVRSSIVYLSLYILCSIQCTRSPAATFTRTRNHNLILKCVNRCPFIVCYVTKMSLYVYHCNFYMDFLSLFRINYHWKE